MYGKGVSKEGCLVDLGTTYEILEKSGTWYSYAGQRLGQGKENVKTMLQENPALSAEIETRVREKVANGVVKINVVNDSEE